MIDNNNTINIINSNFSNSNSQIFFFNNDNKVVMRKSFLKKLGEKKDPLLICLKITH